MELPCTDAPKAGRRNSADASKLLATIVNEKTENDARLTELAEGLDLVLNSDRRAREKEMTSSS
jgi:hypothetical protein